MNTSAPGLDAYYELLDRQIVDPDGRMVGKVDDLELETRADGRLVVTAVLTGPGALGPRLGGALGSIAVATWSRLSGRDPDDPKRIEVIDLVELGTVVRIGRSRQSLDVDGFEGWLRDRVIAALPGAGKRPE